MSNRIFSYFVLAIDACDSFVYPWCFAPPYKIRPRYMLAYNIFYSHTSPHVYECYVFLWFSWLKTTSIRLLKQREAVQTENGDGVRGSLLPLLRLPVCLRGKCESVFLGSNWWKQSDKLPVGWKNMSGVEPTWAKIEAAAPFCCSFVRHFLFCASLSVSASLFLSLTPSFLFAVLFPSSLYFLCVLSLRPTGISLL